MTLVERLLELRLHLAHLEQLRGTIADARQLEGDISLRNDVLHSLQTVCQIVIDVAGSFRRATDCPSRITPRRFASSPASARFRGSWLKRSSRSRPSATSSFTTMSPWS